jgi:hypothetical protein
LSPGSTAPVKILLTSPNIDQIISARLNAQSEDYSMILTTTTESTEASSVPAEDGMTMNKDLITPGGEGWSIAYARILT